MTKPAVEHTLRTKDGLHLHGVADRVANPRAALLIAHGFADHCRRYDEVVRRLNAAGHTCLRFDFRGHGRSEGARGHVYQFDEYRWDFAAAREWLEAEAPAVPRFVLAHSNGGLVALHALARTPGAIDGLVLSSPFFGFQVKVPRLKAALARKMSALMPALALKTELDARTVSHDPEVVRSYATDPLVGRVASSRWYTETVRAHEEAPARARELRLPVLVQQAGDDRIASAAAARAVFERLGSPDRTFELYEGFFHEIWFETNRDRPLAALERWLAAHVAATGDAVN